jgi:hypothetical protein
MCTHGELELVVMLLLLRDLALLSLTSVIGMLLLPHFLHGHDTGNLPDAIAVDDISIVAPLCALSARDPDTANSSTFRG